ncbi:MAG: cytochrome c oxidase subunit II [Alphaproteobacteria bacterium]
MRDRRMIHRMFGIALGVLGCALMAPSALAEDGPQPWQLGFQLPATDAMTRVVALHDFLLYIITAICLFVLLLLVWVMLRFNRGANPVPSRNTHNTTLEIVWTAIPVLILVAIAIPSFRLLYYQDTPPEADLTVKAIGKQWYWTYEYPDHGNFAFDALMLPDDKAKAAGEPRLLATDNRVVVPVGKVVRVITTGADVIHSWTVPAFGVKMDAVPGRINETWFKAEREGVFYGQCSELCGARHAYMPIAVEVVSEDRFAEWVEEAKQKFATLDAPARVAASR